MLLVAATVILAVAATTAVLLTMRGDSSSVSATPRAGWILHERIEIKHVPFAGAGHYVTAVEEQWIQDTPERRFRASVGWSDRPIEVGGDASGRSAFDPKTKTIYHDTTTQVGVPDPTEYYREAAATGATSVEGSTKIDGKTVDKVTVNNAFFAGMIFFVDRDTGRVVRFESPGLPLTQPRGKKGGACSYQAGQPSTTVMRVLAYEYLKPTPERLQQLDLQSRHPNASTAPASAMPESFRQRLHPSCGRSQPSLP